MGERTINLSVLYITEESCQDKGVRVGIYRVFIRRVCLGVCRLVSLSYSCTAALEVRIF